MNMPMTHCLLALIFLSLATSARLRAADIPLNNGDFELPPTGAKESEQDPMAWGTFSSAKETAGISTLVAHGGSQCARLIVPTGSAAEANQGIYQIVPITPGKKYTFTVYVRGDSSSPLVGSVRGQISIEWKDGSDEKKEIDRTWGPDWGASLSSKEWTKVKITGRAPDKASFAAMVVTQFVGPNPSETSGVFYVDDATVTEE